MNRILLTAALLAVQLTASAIAADLAVELRGIQSEEGTLHVAVLNDPDTFPSVDNTVAVAQQAATIGQAVLTIKNLTPGTYAVVAYHDENNDGKLNRFLGMIPTEGYGLSNNPNTMGKPSYEDSAFELPDAGMEISLEMKY